MIPHTHWDLNLLTPAERVEVHSLWDEQRREGLGMHPMDRARLNELLGKATTAPGGRVTKRGYRVAHLGDTPRGPFLRARGGDRTG